jgi:hypothetical protein
MTEETYSQIVKDLMESKSSEVISNSEPSHAQALFQSFFEYAKKEVLIFCHNLDKRVFDDPKIVEMAENAIEKRGISLHVIMQSEPDESLFFNFVNGRANDSAKISITSCKDIPGFNVQEANYTVMDGRAYRYEENRSEIKAIASMNQPEMAGALTRVFNGTRSILCP